MRRVVVLPAPLGPRKPVTDPGWTVKESPSTARTEPKVLLSPLTSTRTGSKRGAEPAVLAPPSSSVRSVGPIQAHAEPLSAHCGTGRRGGRGTAPRPGEGGWPPPQAVPQVTYSDSRDRDRLPDRRRRHRRVGVLPPRGRPRRRHRRGLQAARFDAGRRHPAL